MGKPKKRKRRYASGTKQQRADRVFEIYWELGETRSLERLAKEPKTHSLSTLQNYSRDFHWQERLLTRQEEITAKADKKVAEQEARFIANQKKYLMKRLDEYHHSTLEKRLKSLNSYIELSDLLRRVQKKEDDKPSGNIVVINNIPGE